ncbi:3-deoxy-D-manno-oct-2-ulosonate III transferase WaaZ [Salmonella enterica subsp. diarizonae serovar 53:r:z35]|nr:3-deoxy-D-manno-oct-2-ulosonate III transferase WaaZ [Salmonella enterica subsp. diarizonae serovar 53:r:z35]
MGSVNFITHADVLQLIAKRTAEDCIIFLSGPTSRKTPLSLLRVKDVIAVNGSVQYLLNNNVKPFLYLLTDVRFFHHRREDFYKFSSNSQFTIVNLDVYEQASADDKKYIEENCLIIRSFYRREKGGFLKKIKFNFLKRIYKALLISVPFSKRGRLTGFCKDISIGYCSCHTIAYTAIQVAYSLKYGRIICSGLDLTGSCPRFYDEASSPMPSELSKDLFKILPFFTFMRKNVSDLNIFNLSDDTAIHYDIIPYIKASELEDEIYYDKII